MNEKDYWIEKQYNPSSLVGKTIENVTYYADDGAVGEFALHFTDGTTVVFTGSYDSNRGMDYVSFHWENEKE